jgi:hypothetical protein
MSEAATAVVNHDKLRVRVSRQIASRAGISLLCVAVSAAAVVPFFFMGADPVDQTAGLRMPMTHDMFLQYDQMKSFWTGISSGEIYPRWEEDTNRGFGAPTTSYYPPGVYYITSALFVLVRNWMTVLLLLHLVLMIASAAGLYVYARQLMSRSAAAVAMIVYAIAPYHLLDQYQRGALAELLGFVWMPLILRFLDRLLAGTNRARGAVLNSIAGLAVCYGAFMWSHPPTAYQFTLVLGAYTALRVAFSRNWKGLLASIVGGVIALGLAAAYLLPALLEGDLVRHEYIEENWPYHQSYVFARTAYADWHRNFFDRVDHTWILCVALIVAAGLVLLAYRRTLASPLRNSVASWAVAGCVTVFLMTRFSEPIGRRIPRIEVGVFSWRMLAIATMMSALLVGACSEAGTSLWRERRRVSSLPAWGLTFAAIAAVVVFSVMRVTLPMVYVDKFKPEAEHLNFATIPRGGPKSPEELPEVAEGELMKGNGTVEVEYWKPEARALRVSLSDSDALQVRTFNFPGWTATVDGQAAEIVDGGLGDIVVNLPAGDHRVTLDYLDTPTRKVGGWITIVSALITAFLIVLGRRWNRAAKNLGPAPAH